jgi:antitoxin component YwqK of YwqJK toxin-antitoxin module
LAVIAAEDNLMKNKILILSGIIVAGAVILFLVSNSGGKTVKSYYPEGQLREVNKVKEGKLNGVVKSYYPSGRLKMKLTYRDGVKEGPASFYFESGKLQAKVLYKNDQSEGIQVLF